MDKRTVLAIVLSFLVVMGYQYFYLKTNPPGQEAVTLQDNDAASLKERSAAALEEPQPERLDLYPARKLVDAGSLSADKEKEITVNHPFYTAVFSSRGAALKSFRLKNYRTDIVKDSPLIELVAIKPGMNYPLAVTFPESNIEVPADLNYETDAQSLDLTTNQNVAKLTFSWTYPQEITIEKIYSFYPDTYAFDLEVKIHNLSSNAVRQSSLLSWNQYYDPSVATDSYSHEGPVAYIKDDLVSEKVPKLEARKTFGPDVAWGGVETKYFIASLIPEQPSLTTMSISKSPQDFVSVGLEGPKNTIMPGQSGTFRYALYLGPKDYDILKKVNVGLENSIDFGSWLKWLALPLLMALKYIYAFVHNYGVAIIILTILIKIVFWPLGNMSYKSMKEMQKLQPKITQLREKYKDDKAKMNQEVMELYKTHKVNPLGGCLPILIQIPVFFGLYKTLLYSIELRHSPFFLWIQDLSAKDPYYVTPIIMGATMFLQQKMSPQPGTDAMQAKIMMWMPVVFTFLFLNFPAGLVIYWLFNNILSIGQQYYVNKQTS